MEQHPGAADAGHHPDELVLALHVFLQVLHHIFHIPEFVLVGDGGSQGFSLGLVKGGDMTAVV